MEEPTKSFWGKFWGQPRRFFAWATIVSLIGWLGLSYVLDRTNRTSNWSNNFMLIPVPFCVLFFPAFIGLILSAIPRTRPWMSWVLRRWFFCAAVFATLIGLFYAEENWRGQRALDRAKRELVAKGVVLDWEKFIPPPVPDDQNVFKAPKMQEWFVGRGLTELPRMLQSQTNFPIWGDKRRQIDTDTEARAYLAWSDQFQPQFNLIRDALKRPYSRMDADYSQAMTWPIPNFVAIREVARILAQRAHCYLLQHQPDKALAELAFMHDLRHFTDCRPTGNPMTLVSAMIQISIAGIYTDVIGEGFRTSAWQEPQLVELQKQLFELRLMRPLITALETEPAAITRALETTPFPQVIHAFGTHSALVIAPRGWVLQNIANDLPFYYSRTEALDVEQEGIRPGALKDSQKRLEQYIQRKSPFRILAAILIANINKAARAAARGQISVNEAIIACALERYHIANGAYPDSLDALVPKFLDKLPHDVIGGEPLKYRRTGESFILYSIGWNEKDDGGVTPSAIENGQPDLDNGDWVWQYSAQ